MDHHPKNKQSLSMFGPLILITIGVLWLLNNLGLLPGLNWSALWRYWPLFLIFIGINMIVRNTRGAMGTFLSSLVALAAIVTAGGILLFGDMIAPNSAEFNTEPVLNETVRFVPEQSINSAEIDIDVNSQQLNITALNDSSAVIDGTVSYVGSLLFSNEISNGTGKVKLDTKRSNSAGIFFFSSSWGPMDPWNIGLTPDMPLDLTIDAGSGGVDLDMGSLTLSRFDIDAGSGSLTGTFPDGSYKAGIDTGSGSSTWTLPASGVSEFSFDAGSGSITLNIPSGIAAQIEIDTGSGAFRPDGRFTQVDGNSRSDGTWETAGFDSADDRLYINIDSGSGSVTVQPLTGR